MENDNRKYLIKQKKSMLQGKKLNTVGKKGKFVMC
jgi:hypothetical protein